MDISDISNISVGMISPWSVPRRSLSSPSLSGCFWDMLFLEGRGLSTRCDYRVRAERLVVGTRVFWPVISKVLSFFYPAVYGMCDNDSLIN
jgi:hypothetical protein